MNEDRFIFLKVGSRSTNLADFISDYPTVTSIMIEEIRALREHEVAWINNEGALTRVQRDADRFVVSFTIGGETTIVRASTSFALASSEFFKAVKNVKRSPDGGEVTMQRNGTPHMEARFDRQTTVLKTEVQKPTVRAWRLFNRPGKPCPTCGHCEKVEKTHDLPEGVTSLAEKRRAAALKAVATRRARAAGAGAT